MIPFKIGDAFAKEFCVSEDIYVAFINAFKDSNPLHTDELFAKNKGFKGMVMHGNILNGFISYFVGECLPTKNVIIHSQSIQFKHPVYLSDSLFFEAKVNDVFESVKSIEFKFLFKNSDAKVVAKGNIQIGIL